MAKELKDHNYFGIDATIVADSKNIFGNRITTFVATFPRIVLAEFNTHRMLTRNSASSRAVPFKKMMDRVMKNPFIPIKFQKDHSGMQGDKYLNISEYENAKDRWLKARDRAVENALMLNGVYGVTKQVCNRLLEPFAWHTIITTATEWQNFYALRAHGAAEIHIADLAEKMLKAANISIPKELQPGYWHIPFGDLFDQNRLTVMHGYHKGKTELKISTARCARISYFNFEGKDDYTADVSLHDKLSSPEYGHWSPFEHPNESMSEQQFFNNSIIKEVPLDYRIPIEEIENGSTLILNNPQADGFIRIKEYGWCGNMRGFIPYRKKFYNENKRDSRLLLK